MNIIAQAAKNLPGHWHKGDYADGHGNFCAAGHIMTAAGLSEEQIINEGVIDDEDAIFDVVNEVAGELFPDRAFSGGVKRPYIALFNDHKDTTEDEIVSVLEKAAVMWDEKKDLTD